MGRFTVRGIYGGTTLNKYHAGDATAALRRLYFVLTKWFASATFPIVLIFVLFPAVVLRLVFGAAYTEATVALRILAVAYFLGNLMGPNGATLTAIGRTHVLLWANLLAASLNIGLNIVLIPRLGLTGAAVATATALIVRNTLRVVVLYRDIAIHSLRTPLVGPMLVTTSVVLALYLPFGGLIASPESLVGALVAIAACYLGVVYVTGNVGHEDRWLLQSITR